MDWSTFIPPSWVGAQARKVAHLVEPAGEWKWRAACGVSFRREPAPAPASYRRCSRCALVAALKSPSMTADTSG